MGERSETNEVFRALEAERRAERRRLCLEARAELDRRVAAGELTYVALDGDHHLRLTCGRHRVDLWPSNGRWRLLGEKGRTRSDGLRAVVNFLGLERIPPERPT